eukprot:sb/3470216/
MDPSTARKHPASSTERCNPEDTPPNLQWSGETSEGDGTVPAGSPTTPYPEILAGLSTSQCTPLITISPDASPAVFRSESPVLSEPELRCPSPTSSPIFRGFSTSPSLLSSPDPLSSPSPRLASPVRHERSVSDGNITPMSRLAMPCLSLVLSPPITTTAAVDPLEDAVGCYHDDKSIRRRDQHPRHWIYPSRPALLLYALVNVVQRFPDP